MFTFLVVMSVIMGHMTIGGASYAKIQQVGRANCRYVRHNSDCGHNWLAGLSLVLWPVILPCILGALMVGGGRMGKDEKRRSHEIEEANHRRELARIAAEEDAILTKQLAANRHR